MNKKRLIIVGVSRSGTTALQSVLSKHGDIAVCPREVRVSPLFARGMSSLLDIRNEDLDRYFPQVFDCLCRLDRDGQVLGMKIATHIPEEAQALVRQLQGNLKDCHVLHIRRGDEIARLLSHMVARFTGTYHVAGGGKIKKEDLKVWISPSCLKLSMLHSQKINEALEGLSNSHPYMSLAFEDFLERKTETVNRVLDWLGLTPQDELKSEFSKRLAHPRDVVVNYDKLSMSQRQWMSSGALDRMRSSRMRMWLVKLNSMYEGYMFRRLNRSLF